MSAQVTLKAALVMGLMVGCSGDDGDAPRELSTGLYQLSTFEITGDCKLDNALSPDTLFVGHVIPVAVTASAVSVDVKVCDHPDEDPACFMLGNAFDFSMARDGNDLVGAMPLWLIPGCGCTSFDGNLTVTGELTDDDQATLTWSATITAPDPNCECDGYRVCSSTIKQRMAIADGTQ